MVKMMNKTCAILLLTGSTILSGCVSYPEKMPEYAGQSCSFMDVSRVVQPNEFYAVCKNNKWKVIPADEFKSYIVTPPKDQPYTSTFTMRDSNPQSARCISVKQHYKGFQDYDIDGTQVIRKPIYGSICVDAECEADSKPFDVRACN